ncbi:MAG: hypothetical protein IT370_23915 [Deltaproteobacteria bacterium]|nr:hypothetical protein [Deltaproteobacteria bacterium]
MTAGAFAAKHGLTRRRLTWWQERLGQTAGPRGSVSAPVAPVDIISAAVPSAASTIEVLLRGGRAVRVGADVDEAALARIVAALEALC